jgi:hypothetical protein
MQVAFIPDGTWMRVDPGSSRSKHNAFHARAWKAFSLLHADRHTCVRSRIVR